MLVKRRAGSMTPDSKTTTGLAYQAYRDARPAEKIDRTPHDTRYLTRYIESPDQPRVSRLGLLLFVVNTLFSAVLLYCYSLRTTYIIDRA